MTLSVVAGIGTPSASEITTMVAISLRLASLRLDSFNPYSATPAYGIVDG
jgi:hypothetical protein